MKYDKSIENKEIELKIIYWGYGLSGKTTNIDYIYNNTKEKNRIEFRTYSKEANVLECKVRRKMKPLSKNTILTLMAKVGNIYSPKTEFEILQNVDGIVFVAHSHKDLMHLNISQLEDLQEYLKNYGYEIDKLPYVLQCNKRDIKEKLAIEDIVNQLCIKNEPVFEAIAYKGVGVFETLDCLVNQILITKYKHLY